MKVAERDSLYERDFFEWTQLQAHILHMGDTLNIDSENIAEEIESLGLSQKRELVNRLAVLVAHLIKWDQQPEKRTSSWQNTIFWQRVNIETLLEDSPSLVTYAETTAFERAYKKALRKAEDEMDGRVTVRHIYGYDEAMTVRRVID